MLSARLRPLASVADLAILAGVTILGFCSAPWWVILAGGFMLFGLALLEHADLRFRMSSPLAVAAVSRAALMLAIASGGFAALSYFGGHLFAALLLS
jgi:hypothetical protein